MDSGRLFFPTGQLHIPFLRHSGKAAFMKNVIFALVMLTFISVTFAQDGEFHLDKKFNIEKNGTLDISTSDAKVFITGSSRPDAHIKIDRKVSSNGWNSGKNEFEVEVEEFNGGLRIRESQTGPTVSVGYFHEEYRIDIEAPDGISLVVRGDDGDYFIKNVNGAISMSLDDADAELTGCKGSDFRFRFDDGDLRMDQGKGNITIDADDADIEIYKASFSSVEASVDDGDLIIETSLSDNGRYNINSQDGFVSLRVSAGGGDFDILHDDANLSFQGGFKSLEQSENKTRLSLHSGNAKVIVRADDATVKLSAAHQ